MREFFNIFDSGPPERQIVFDALDSNKLNDADRGLLIHLLNVTSRKKPESCAFYGRLHENNGELIDGESNALERCLVPEIRNTKDCCCPFYDKDMTGYCKYPYNRK